MIPATIASHDQKVMLHLISVILSYGRQWCHWWSSQCHMMPTPAPWCDITKRVMLHLVSIILWNALVWLRLLLVSCDSTAVISGITVPKMSCCTSFQSSGKKECSSIIDSVVSIMWCWHWHQWHHINKSHVPPHFTCLDLWNAMVALILSSTSYDAQCKCQWHHITKMSCCTICWSSWPKVCNGVIDDSLHWPKNFVAPHFTCLYLRNAMAPLMTLLTSLDANAGANGVT